ncbi:Ribonuclease H [Yarrowia sp. B02]|nr:Ribonuclease H [Yarrowia sp. B02]
MKKYYAVKVGYNPGIYEYLEEARAQITGYPNAQWKGFNVYQHAQEYLTVKNEPQIHYVVKDMIFNDLSVARKYATGSYIEECLSLEGAIYLVGRNGYRTYIKGFAQDLSYVNNQGDRIYLVYTDGACSRNGQPDAAAGYGIYFGNNNPMNTNQRAELAAITRTLQILSTQNDRRMYQICTDSAYAINCLSKWVVEWQKNGWINEKGQPVANRDLIEDIVNLNRTCDNVVGLKQVQGHSDSEGNNEADRLAKEACRR